MLDRIEDRPIGYKPGVRILDEKLMTLRTRHADVFGRTGQARVVMKIWHVRLGVRDTPREAEDKPAIGQAILHRSRTCSIWPRIKRLRPRKRERDREHCGDQ